ncbi:GDSL-type esterase/lipase family protein [Chitinophaga japonensis]|uniref:Lysophospholipase L1-like esterase n=1 Tax=Chitinophaga japonensis TaxID=104662 RepID=A0A562TFD7_CHIJA|nr:GDSL-type esterase/lipase family protein [Chitinophaga japonensis]TWI92251.1 lysophospholipase L1-like esterase [Chitinophaga japonensis]
MPANNRSAHPFYIIAGTMVCLLALSSVNNSFSLQGYRFRKVDLLADIKKEIPARISKQRPLAQKPAPDTLHATDSLQAAQMPAHTRPSYDFMTYTGIQENFDTASAGMQHFLQALQELKEGKRRKVRIAYFGDSMIEGDLITSDLRDSLQAIFGGAGVGFVPVTSIVAAFRGTIRHTFSDNWTDYHFKNNPPEDVLLGLSGHAFFPEAESWAKYSPVQKRRLDRFKRVSVFYGPVAGNCNVAINNKVYTLTGTAPLNELSLRQDTLQRSVLLQYAGGEPLPFYGLSFESDTGIYVDNFSFRGISGVELGKLRSRMLQQMQRSHPYDLVVLHYGANVLFRPEATDYSWYQQLMQRVLASLRSNWPRTSFLIVGTADKAYKKADHYVTAPGVPALLKVQHALAQEHGTAYWNLYAAMGGEGSMTHWVEGDTILANKDYTHFNRHGAARVGALLYKAIMDEFKQEVHPYSGSY